MSTGFDPHCRSQAKPVMGVVKASWPVSMGVVGKAGLD